MLEPHSKWRYLLQRFNFPANVANHSFPHFIEGTQLLPRLDEGEEHAELRTAETLKEAAKHVVVIKEVLAPCNLEVCEGLLQLGERHVQHL